MSQGEQPLFNIARVVEETSLPADTLRAWERRYGWPLPQRSAGGHRLYSRRDIEGIKWLKAEMATGLTIAQAVRLWRERHDRLETLGVFEEAAIDGGQVGESQIEGLRAAWIEACARFDETEANAVLLRAFALHKPSVICAEVLQKGLAEMGESWHRNQLTVQQEHFASALVMRQMNALIIACPQPTGAQGVLVACAPGEEHAYPALYLTWELRQLGFPVVYLGANVPEEKLLETVEQVQPSLVVLSATLLSSAAALLAVAESLGTRRIKVAYGGRAFETHPEIRQHVPAAYIGERLQGAGQTIANLLQQPALKVAVRLRKRYAEDQSSFARTLAHVNQRVLDESETTGIGDSSLANASQFWIESLKAGAAFGNLGILAGELEWLETWLASYRVPKQALVAYLQTFASAAKEPLNILFPSFQKDLETLLDNFHHGNT